MHFVPSCLVFHLVDKDFNLVLRNCVRFDSLVVLLRWSECVYLIDVVLRVLKACTRICNLLRGLPRHIVKSLVGRFHKRLQTGLEGLLLRFHLFFEYFFLLSQRSSLHGFNVRVLLMVRFPHWYCIGSSKHPAIRAIDDSRQSTVMFASHGFVGWQEWRLSAQMHTVGQAYATSK